MASKKQTEGDTIHGRVGENPKDVIIGKNINSFHDIQNSVINIAGRDIITQTFIRQVNKRPAILYWLLIIALLGLYLILWFATSVTFGKNNFTKPLDLLTSYANLALTQDGQVSPPPLPTQLTSVPTIMIKPTFTNTPLPVTTSKSQCTAKGDLPLLDRAYWLGELIGIVVPNGTTLNPIAWDGDKNSPWVFVIYHEKQGWYSANQSDLTHFDCTNVISLATRESLPPLVSTPAPPQVSPTPDSQTFVPATDVPTRSDSITGAWTGRNGNLELIVEKVEIRQRLGDNKNVRFYVSVNNQTGDSIQLPLYGYFVAVDSTGKPYQPNYSGGSNWPQSFPSGLKVSGSIDLMDSVPANVNTMSISFTNIFGSLNVRGSITINNISIP